MLFIVCVLSEWMGAGGQTRNVRCAASERQWEKEGGWVKGRG